MPIQTDLPAPGKTRMPEDEDSQHEEDHQVQEQHQSGCRMAQGPEIIPQKPGVTPFQKYPAPGFLRRWLRGDLGKTKPKTPHIVPLGLRWLSADPSTLRKRKACAEPPELNNWLPQLQQQNKLNPRVPATTEALLCEVTSKNRERRFLSSSICTEDQRKWHHIVILRRSIKSFWKNQLLSWFFWKHPLLFIRAYKYNS